MQVLREAPLSGDDVHLRRLAQRLAAPVVKCVYTYVYIYIYIYTQTAYTYIYIYIYILLLATNISVTYYPRIITTNTYYRPVLYY